MAPLGFDLSDDLDNLTQQAPAPATILVISSQEAAQDGSYQSLVNEFNQKGKVEMHMFDRIVEGAATLPSEQYTHISLLLPSTLITSSLLSVIEPSLQQGGILEVLGTESSSSEEVITELKSVGLNGVSQSVEGKDKLICSKTTPENPLSSSTTNPNGTSLNDSGAAPAAAISLPLRSSRAAKASLWAFTSGSANGTSTPTIDESTLLTKEDLERPNLIKREDCDVKKTRKACKNCSCGLREILLQEKDDLGQAGFAEAGIGGSDSGVKGIGANVTSSCGSCYLGDAFRCASCPYLGMPAFEPGQKVTMSGHDDKAVN